MGAAKAKEPKATEKEMLDLLEASLTKVGNGGAGEFAFLRQVRNHAGFNATRTFDGLSVSLWPSRGHTLHVYEVKVSRSDLLRELAKPDKAEDAAKVADHFSIVAPRGVCTLDDLPPTWGYIEASGGVEVTEEQDIPGLGLRPVTRIEGRRLRTVRKAPLLHPDDPERHRQPLPRGVVVAMLRAAGAVPDPQGPTRTELAAEFQRGHDAAVKNIGAKAEAAEGRLEQLEQALRVFQTHSGLTIADTYRFSRGKVDEERLRRLGVQVREALADDNNADRVAGVLRRAMYDIERLEQSAKMARNLAESVISDIADRVAQPSQTA